MAYVDTNVIIAYGFDRELNHDKAVDVMEKSKSIGKFYGSPLTLVELYCVLYRNIQKYRLPPGIEQMVDERGKVKATVSYLLSLLDIKIFSDELKSMNLNNAKLFHIFYEAIQLVHKIKLKTLDMLHLTYVNQLAKMGIINCFITLDSTIAKRGKDIQQNVRVSVISG